MADVKQIILRTQQPLGDDDPGRCEIGFYKVENAMVVLCDDEGRPTGKRLALGPDDDPGRIAHRLLREGWLKSAGTSNFGRPIGAVPRGIA